MSETSNRFVLTVARLEFAVQGDVDLIEALAENFASFSHRIENSGKASPPSGKRRFFVVWSGLQAFWGEGDPPADLPESAGTPENSSYRLLRVSDPTFRLGATHLLLHRAIDEGLPQVISLHGNALHKASGPLGDPMMAESSRANLTGRTLILLGDSGVGKTSLTLGRLEGPENKTLLETGKRYWRLACEDAVLLDPDIRPDGDSMVDVRCYWPFPRAAGIREYGEADAAKAALRRVGMGSGAPAKRIEPYPPELLAPNPHSPLPLGDVDIVFLEWPSRQNAEPASAAVSVLNSAQNDGSDQHAYRVYLTWAESDLPARLAGQGLPGSELMERGGVYSLLFARPLTFDETAKLDAEAARDGGFLLSGGVESPDSRSSGESREPSESGARTGKHERPAAPAIERLAPTVGLRLLLDYIRRPSVASAAQVQGALLFRLAKFFPNARFYRLVPGGTPEATNRLLSEVVLARDE